MQSNIPLYLKIHTYYICNVCMLRRLKTPNNEICTYYERTLAEIIYIYQMKTIFLKKKICFVYELTLGSVVFSSLQL